jgi:HPt (histidine-containing phosphotransfer) domain-containing protein
MDDVPVLDEGALARLDDWGGAKLRRQMVRLYLENARTRLAQLDEGLAAGGVLETAELAAHSLKSSAANVGLMRVSTLAGRIETATEVGDVEAAREARADLEAAVREGERVIADHLTPEDD